MGLGGGISAVHSCPPGTVARNMKCFVDPTATAAGRCVAYYIVFSWGAKYKRERCGTSAMCLTKNQTRITPCKLLSLDEINAGPIFAWRISHLADGAGLHRKLVF